MLLEAVGKNTAHCELNCRVLLDVEQKILCVAFKDQSSVGHI